MTSWHRCDKNVHTTQKPLGRDRGGSTNATSLDESKTNTWTWGGNVVDSLRGAETRNYGNMSTPNSKK